MFEYLSFVSSGNIKKNDSKQTVTTKTFVFVFNQLICKLFFKTFVACKLIYICITKIVLHINFSACVLQRTMNK